MKKLTLLVTVAAMLMFAQFVNAQHIAGSAHDFSGAAWNTTTQQICIVCHAPHAPGAALPDAPLWNHQLTTQTFVLYASGTLNAIVGQPDGSSKMCLSCHDGTVALENFGGFTGGTHFVTGNSLIGTNLSNDHPISFTYDAALAAADGQLYNPVTTLSGITTTGHISDDMLFSNKMQCASCHDVHAHYGFAKLLVKNNLGSALCLTCHNK